MYGRPYFAPLAGYTSHQTGFGGLVELGAPDMGTDLGAVEAPPATTTKEQIASAAMYAGGGAAVLLGAALMFTRAKGKR